MTLEALQERMTYGFRDGALLVTALTHSSWINEHNSPLPHNERLEFLGDAVLELVVSQELFARFPEAREGDMTRMRSGLVNTVALAGIAREQSLDTLLCLGKGEESQGGRQRDPLLADALEALLGAVFLDGGFASAQQVILRMFARLWPQQVQQTRRKDWKTQLQEATQRYSGGLPCYTLENSQGPEHARMFTVRVDLPDGQRYIAEGASLKRAEQEAAQIALSSFMEKRSPKRCSKTDRH